MIYEYQDKIGDRFERYKKLRKERNYKESDTLRNELQELGYEIRDTEEMSMIVKTYF